VQQTRNDLFEKNRDKHIKFRVWPLRFEFQFERQSHAFGEVNFPTGFPIVDLRQIAAISGYMEAELAIWRLAVLMKRC